MNYFADQRHADTYCSEADLADKFGITTRDIRGMIRDGRLPEGDIVIQGNGVTQHCYTEGSADAIVSTCSNISSSANKETKMTNTATSTPTKKINRSTVTRLNRLEDYKVTECLVNNFSRFNKANMPWAKIVTEVKKATNVFIANHTAYDRMRLIANDLGVKLNAKQVKSKNKNRNSRSSRPSSKVNAGTLVMEDGTTFKVTLLSKTPNTNA